MDEYMLTDLQFKYGLRKNLANLERKLELLQNKEYSKLEKEYRFPIAKTTSVEYAPNGLFLTTGNRPWSEEEFIRNHAGGVWHLPFETLETI